MPAPSGKSFGAQAYWAAARSHRYSLLLALPLLVIYEVLAVFGQEPGTSGVINGADAMLRDAARALFGPWGPTAVMAVAVIVCVVLVRRDIQRNGRVRLTFLGLMLVESAVLAAAFGIVVGMATAALLGQFSSLAIGAAQNMSLLTRLMLSLGAGLFEELVFRVLLVGGLAFGGRALLGMSRMTAGLMATIVGALVFSACHYIGPLGDTFQVSSFVFRAISGVVFSALYLTRGFGITAWTHALYDIGVLVLA